MNLRAKVSKQSVKSQVVNILGFMSHKLCYNHLTLPLLHEKDDTYENKWV